MMSLKTLFALLLVAVLVAVAHGAASGLTSAEEALYEEMTGQKPDPAEWNGILSTINDDFRPAAILKMSMAMQRAKDSLAA